MDARGQVEGSCDCGAPGHRPCGHLWALLLYPALRTDVLGGLEAAKRNDRWRKTLEDVRRRTTFESPQERAAGEPPWYALVPPLDHPRHIPVAVGQRIQEIIGDRVTGIPDLVVEILSPSTSRRDRHKKSEIYARFGAREYWLVDPKDRSVEIRARRGTEFVRFAHETGDTALASALDPDLTVVPSTLFRDFGR